jgi:hypothetical protein
MGAVHGHNFKIVYPNWFVAHGQQRPFGNGIHPVIREYVKNEVTNNTNDDWFDKLQYQQEEKAFKFDHSELYNYFVRNYPNNIIPLTEIKDDGIIYIYPLEIKATLGALNDENGFVLNDTQYKWYLKDIIPSEIIEYAKLGKVKILINIIHDPLYDDNHIRMFELQMNDLEISGSNIIFLGGSNFSEYYQKHPTSNVKIYNGHLFIRGYVDEITTFPCIGNLGYVCELFEEKDLDSTKIRKNKFISPNRTMEKHQRTTLAYFALKYGLINEGCLLYTSPSPRDES